MYNEQSYVQRAKAQTSSITSRITNATKANQKSLSENHGLFPFINRYRPSNNKIYSILLLAGGVVAYKFWNSLSIDKLQSKIAKKADKAVSNSVVTVLHCNEV
jgi:hypothetical protein